MKLYSKFASPSLSVLALLIHQYIVLFLSCVGSGDQDMVISYVGTMAWIRKLNLSASDRWRPWFVKGQVAG